jgi:hypothetical protein
MANIRSKWWRHRLYDVIDVRAIDQSDETITPKLDSPGGDVMKQANLASHSSATKYSGHFAAVRALIRRGCGYDIHSRATFDPRFGC